MITKIIFKIFTLIDEFQTKLYLKTCIARGMKVGKNVQFIDKQNFGSEPFLIEIGDGTKLTNGVTFINHDGAAYVIQNFEKYKHIRNFGRIKIGKNCFIGLNSIILPNVEIGDNSIVGTNSVVSKSLAENGVYAGNPASFICSIEEYAQKMIQKNTTFPSELENNRKELEKYLSKNLPNNFKK